MSDNVIEFPTDTSPKNRECPVCGSQWWTVQAVVMDEGLHIGGFAGVPQCYECSGGDLLVLKGDVS